jgi:hypothetical protein
MARSHSRIFFSVAVGVSLTFLAGYIGSLAFPGLVAIWLWSLLTSAFVGGAKATLALLIVPSMTGAQFAWPVTCILFPLIGLVRQPATISTVFVLSGCGTLLGASITYIRFVTHLIFYVNPQDHLHFVLASAIAGAVLGGVFGFCLWRFDVAYPTRGPAAATQRGWGSGTRN